MEMTTLVGLLIGAGGIVLGNLIEGGEVASLAQGAAAVIVLCGTAGAVIVSSRKRDLQLGLSMFRNAFSTPNENDSEEILRELLECSKLSRKESILSIEPRIAKMQDPFMQNVMRAVVDNVPGEVLRDLFEREITIEEERLMSGAKVWTDAGGYSPTIGIIGAVLGLIHVMGNLSDTSKLGSGIAVAFVATVYGVGLANLFFLPIGNKLKKWVQHQVLLKEMILEGGLSIQGGLNPTLTEVKLKPFVEKVG